MTSIDEPIPYMPAAPTWRRPRAAPARSWPAWSEVQPRRRARRTGTGAWSWWVGSTARSAVRCPTATTIHEQPACAALYNGD
jgi:hypothetical protein